MKVNHAFDIVNQQI